MIKLLLFIELFICLMNSDDQTHIIWSVLEIQSVVPGQKSQKFIYFPCDWELKVHWRRELLCFARFGRCAPFRQMMVRAGSVLILWDIQQFAMRKQHFSQANHLQMDRFYPVSIAYRWAEGQCFQNQLSSWHWGISSQPIHPSDEEFFQHTYHVLTELIGQRPSMDGQGYRLSWTDPCGWNGVVFPLAYRTQPPKLCVQISSHLWSIIYHNVS